jgi:hypothetical protein
MLSRIERKSTMLPILRRSGQKTKVTAIADKYGAKLVTEVIRESVTGE